MMRRAFGSTLIALALAVACGGPADSPTPRSALAGVWDLTAVNGAALPTASPEEEDVLLESVTMTLGAGGEYALLSTFRQGEGAGSTDAAIGGTWRATGDVLTFHNEQGPAIVEFGYRLEGDRLRMRDEAGHEWELRRRG